MKGSLTQTKTTLSALVIFLIIHVFSHLLYLSFIFICGFLYSLTHSCKKKKKKKKKKKNTGRTLSALGTYLTNYNSLIYSSIIFVTQLYLRIFIFFKSFVCVIKNKMIMVVAYTNHSYVNPNRHVVTYLYMDISIHIHILVSYKYGLVVVWKLCQNGMKSVIVR